MSRFYWGGGGLQYIDLVLPTLCHQIHAEQCGCPQGGPNPVFLNPVFQGSSCIHCAALQGLTLARKLHDFPELWAFWEKGCTGAYAEAAQSCWSRKTGFEKQGWPRLVSSRLPSAPPNLWRGIFKPSMARHLGPSSKPGILSHSDIVFIWCRNMYLRWRCSPEGVALIREQKTVPLVNHAFARGTPAIFVVFVVSRGLSSKALVLLARTQIRHFRRFRQNPPRFGGTKARFTKSTVSWTPNWYRTRTTTFLIVRTCYRPPNPEKIKVLSSTKTFPYEKQISELFLLSGYNYKYINNGQKK